MFGSKEVKKTKLDKNNPIGAAQLPSPEKTTQVWRKEPTSQENKEVLTIAGKIAKSPIYCRNYKIPNAIRHFPVEPLMRTVDKYFQFADGGPLWVDEPVSERDVINCRRKAEAMAKEKARYAYIEKDMTLNDVLGQLDSHQKEMEWAG
jgi:hypothetical protein